MNEEPAMEPATEAELAQEASANEAAQSTESAPSGISDEIDMLIEKANSIAVADMNACGDAGELIKELTRAVKQIKEDLEPLKAKLTEAKQEFQEAERNRLKPVVEAEKLVKSNIESFLSDETERRRHERELQELSRQEAIAEREQKIQELEEEGKVDEARTLASEYPPELPPAKPLPVPQTISTRATRRAEVNDIQAMIRYVAANPEYSNLLRPAAPALNALARRTKDKSHIPGVEFVTEQKVTAK